MLVVPLVAGARWGGARILTRTDLAEVRQNNAEGAATAFVPRPGSAPGFAGEPAGAGGPAPVAGDPGQSTRADDGADVDPQTPEGGGGVASTDDEGRVPLFEQDQAPVTGGALVRGLSVMLLQPYPWAVSDNPSVEIARYESFLWWPLLALALVGVVVGRRWPAVTVYPLLYAGGMTLVYALAEGNFGTAYRHRGELVWPAALFATLGARWLWQRWSSPRRQETA
jgi:hypothetical protein